ncbi:phospholipase D-like domain-containing protein [Candidatus Cardinium hertigii]|uniref:phospholipase D-like domain-containing protein n=1 Tax=Candidatus Cardinium hertigii TaxID=247481 RepID=UPI003D7DF953
MHNQFDQSRSSSQLDPSQLSVFPCFMPDEPCVDRIVQWINDAKKSIMIQAYKFSSIKIANALINAKKRRVRVEMLIDKNAKSKEDSLIEKLNNNGIYIKVDGGYGKAHNKVMIIDDERVITGSYNWTDERYYYDSDVIVFINDECVNNKFKDNYEFINNQEYTYKSGYDHSYLNLLHNSGYNPCGAPCDTMLSRDQPRLYQFISYNMTDEDGFTQYIPKEKKKKEKSKDYNVEINACFPRYNNQDCIKLISNCINNAQKSVYIQSYSLTHEDIFNSLIYSYRKNVDIKILTNEEAFQDSAQKIHDLVREGIEVKYEITNDSGNAHSKTIIIDDNIVLTGSMNLSKNAQKYNLENLLSIKNIYVNTMFKKHFCKKWNENLRQNSLPTIPEPGCIVS